MRTTLDIDDDVLAAARDLGRRQRKALGAVISELARQALLAPKQTQDAKTLAEPEPFYGFAPLPARGVVVSDALINRLRDEVGD